MNWSIIRNFLPKKGYFGIKSFTYFLPSPPSRKQGYQEKEFDHIFSHLLKPSDYDLIDLKMETLNTPESSGVWILCLLGAKTKEAMERQINIDYHEVAAQLSTHIKMDPLIEHDT